MPIRLGNIASGDDFFDRATELEDLWRYLEGNHVALTGPRRLGKSSLLKRLGEQAAAHGLLSRLIDVEGLDSATAFIDALEDAYPDGSLKGHMLAASEKVTEWFARLRKVDLKLPGGIGGGLELQAQLEAPWGAKAQAIRQRLADAPALLLIDEFSVFLEKLIARDMREAALLLGWLRTWRMSDSTCRFIYSGSIGLNALLERHDLTTWMNDCYEFKLGPFGKPSAVAMLTTLSGREGYELPADSADYLCRRTGWLSPFYLNLLLDETMKAARDRLLECGEVKRELRAGDVDDAYDRLLAARSRFIHWFKRLKRDLPEPTLSFTLAVLRYVARAEVALSRRQLLSRLAKLETDTQLRIERLSAALLYLEENGYIGQEDEGQMHFIAFLLRDYWRRNHAD